jgi:hypothetical protein
VAINSLLRRLAHTKNVSPCLLAWLGACGASSPGSNDAGSSSDTGGAGSSAEHAVETTDDPAADSSDSEDSTGGTAPIEPPYASGSRMRARLIDGGGGAVLPSGWYDTELGIDCEVFNVADAGGRCVPGPIYGVTAYSDPACTQPAYVGFCELPEFAVMGRADADACAEDWAARVYRVGAAIEGEIYVQDVDGCVAQQAYDTYALEPVDPAMFAAYEREVVARDDELATTVWRGDDGSYAWSGAHDLGREVDCEVLASAPDRCVPLERGAVLDDHHRDAACTTGGVASSFYPPACGPSPVVEDQGGALYEVGSALDPDAVFHEDEGCAPGAGAWLLDWGLFEVGALALQGAFPELGRTQVGNDRLQLTLLSTSAGDAFARHGGFTDTSLELECYPVATSAGLRCLPAAAADVRFWVDDTCTGMQLHHSYVDATTPPVIPTYADDICGEPVGAVRLGAEHLGAVFFDDGVGCTPYEVYETDRFLRVDAQLALTDFAALELTID